MYFTELMRIPFLVTGGCRDPKQQKQSYSTVTINDQAYEYMPVVCKGDMLLLFCSRLYT